MSPLVQGLVTILIGVGGCVGYFYLSNLVLDRVIFPARGPDPGRNISRANAVRPWLFLFPAMAALGLYLVYPVVGSFWRSLFDRDGDEFIGAGNYASLAADETFRTAVFNNLLWVLVVPAAATFIGLVSAQLTDRLRWGNLAKSMIFMPMAISFVGASLIWKFVYANEADIGLINAIRAALGADNPVDVLQIPFWNNFFLMMVLIWIQTGFAMVILSAALRGIPEETVEAAIIDGANPFQIFFRIKVPQIMGTIVVVWTTITILVLKVFDIVYTMTGGNFGTQILPSYMMGYMFRDDGRATAVAFVIMVLVLPVMVWNIRQARKELR
ncbi:carbohydrate ABC transporter permease [Rhodovulum adriaticum]|uniref:Maltose ABC transporter membrane protein /trehalose ABC transporter membrane protein /sucrose ABC transporter membrane protein n=1 Tax=Rhodovulum adriaticum TaxID=35804 RepID=A0A4R2NNC1_RHOAD|nr:sugar ABC transporter permease [Rhodovulum adriaticum]MBK1636926.1 alpha-glucoside ABC transporter permease [Rhodovulum adriaticum]TCP22798.1 maltose ABC transporter membrane protein /trehalose ABC transporter membrane protein /sucrose ABC transporter membrane protein [Rhodovulum adriaticum]